LHSLISKREDVSKIIAERTGRKVEEINKISLDRETINPERAVKIGLVKEILRPTIPKNDTVLSITDVA